MGCDLYGVDDPPNGLWRGTVGSTTANLLIILISPGWLLGLNCEGLRTTAAMLTLLISIISVGLVSSARVGALLGRVYVRGCLALGRGVASRSEYWQLAHRRVCIEYALAGLRSSRVPAILRHGASLFACTVPLSWSKPCLAPLTQILRADTPLRTLLCKIETGLGDGAKIQFLKKMI